ncbi:adenosine kinase [Aquicella lusitana]|uniref:Sugar/nucleoside kinase (Ribokinase family) n=1 Tax=Aquicella lusitana TaxID=254246 RepID=A0A370GLA9_9COXI|nr:adenosine kinase [Aquicella lusitana]RDI44552.1 sugar/nucleoside kinase (ribokinase family) [Aquicella lusitana]VVC72506.1 2-dehydro-3-deoxygluconokinase [Aquicella lusitana]
MKQFHVYGIGNALVDIDFEVSPGTLERLNIAKGVMTLIDEPTHHRLLEELDGIKHLKACGGSAANTLFTMQQLGGKTFYSCKVGNDEAGDFFYRDLILHGIHTNLHETHRSGVTGKCIVLVTPDADRTMNTFLGATSEFSKTQLCESSLKKSEYLYIEGYLVAAAPGCEAAITAREMAEKYQLKIALSLSDPNMVTYFKDGLCAIIGKQIDILFCNDREALLFTEANNLEEASERLKKYTRAFVITMGSKGALIFDGQQHTHIPAYKVNVVDTVGAGDVFAGAFLYGITHGYSYVEAGQLASFAASKVVSKFGPRLTELEIKGVQDAFVKQVMYA